MPQAKPMRCKVEITEVTLGKLQDNITARPVCKAGAYPSDGSDEDNTFAKFSPSGEFKLTVANPDLLGIYRPGQKFYVDWTPIEEPNQNGAN